MSFNRLDTNELASVGIRFKTKEESLAFAGIIRKELELRVGEIVSSRVSREQLKEYTCCKTEEEEIQWVRKNCPEHKQIVDEEKEKLGKEIMKYRYRIPGLLSDCEKYYDG